jgi:hypothetical protein
MSAFEGCNGLASVTILAGSISIKNWAFKNCYNLASLTIQANYIGIGYNVFENCHSLKMVVLPGNVRSGGHGFPGGLQFIHLEDLRAAQTRQRNAALIVLLLCTALCAASCVGIVRMKGK